MDKGWLGGETLYIWCGVEKGSLGGERPCATGKQLIKGGWVERDPTKGDWVDKEALPIWQKVEEGWMGEERPYKLQLVYLQNRLYAETSGIRHRAISSLSESLSPDKAP